MIRNARFHCLAAFFAIPHSGTNRRRRQGEPIPN
jgi:hypothetical protein